MARFILRPKIQAKKQAETTRIISLTSQGARRHGQEIDAGKLALRLRKPRSKTYCQAMQKLASYHSYIYSFHILNNSLALASAASLTSLPLSI